MPFSVDIKIEGAEKLVPLAERITKGVEKAIDDNVETLIQPVVETAKQLAPKSEPPDIPTYYHGALKDSIKGEKIAPLTGKVGDGVFYGVYQELGYYHKSGKWIQNPFLFPALEIEFPQVKDQVDKLVKSVTKQLKQKKTFHSQM